MLLDPGATWGPEDKFITHSELLQSVHCTETQKWRGTCHRSLSGEWEKPDKGSGPLSTVSGTIVLLSLMPLLLLAALASIFKTILRGRSYYYSHFIGDKTEA